MMFPPVPPRTPNELIQLKAKIVARDRENDIRFGGVDPESPIGPPLVYTCDDCTEAFTCHFTYDPYNTDGDCIASK